MITCSLDGGQTRFHFALGFHGRSSFRTSNLRQRAFTRFVHLELVGESITLCTLLLWVPP